MSKTLTILIIILVILCVFMIYFFWTSYNSFQKELLSFQTTIESNESELKINKIYDLVSDLSNKNIESKYQNNSGQGVRIRIDSGYVGSQIIHDSDILSLINELYLLDLKDIDINNIRIIPYSTVRCVGPTISINGHPTQISPILVEVLGDPDYIISGLSLINESFKERGIDISMLALDYIQIGDEGS